MFFVTLNYIFTQKQKCFICHGLMWSLMEINISSAAEMDFIIHKFNKQISMGFPVKSRLVLVINKRNDVI